MVDCTPTRRHFCLAPRDSAARNRFRGRIASLLDGCRFSPASVPGATPGLLFNDHVERICALGGHCVGPNTTAVTLCRHNRCRTSRDNSGDSGILSCRRGARSEWKLGNDGRTLDGLEGVARYASLNLAVLSTFGCDLCRLTHFSVAPSPVPCWKTTRETRSHRARRLNDPGRAQHDGSCRTHRPLFFSC